MRIRLLPEGVVNRIAAGEVIERPASVVKELVENAIDAGARSIEITLEESGRRLIRVADDGRGMDCDELPLALARHATSKLTEDGDLWSIKTLGFRGEALPSIAAVSRLTLTSRWTGSDNAWSIEAAGGAPAPCTPAARPQGTTVAVADLFYATPARLKFLKAPRTESGHAADTVNRLAMCHPAIGFTLVDDGRTVLRDGPHEDAPVGRLARLALVMGRDFSNNALPIDAEREGVRLTGYAALPTPQPRECTAPIPLRQRPAGARPHAARRRARGLCRLPPSRPPSHGGALRRPRIRHGGRERSPDEGRGALSQCGPGARAYRQRTQARASRRGASRGDNCCRRRPCRAQTALRSGRRRSRWRRRSGLRHPAAIPGTAAGRSPCPLSGAAGFSLRPNRQPATGCRGYGTGGGDRGATACGLSLGLSPAGRYTAPTSWLRPKTASSSSISTPPTSASSTSG